MFCPICNATTVRNIGSVGVLGRKKTEVDYVKCIECNHRFINPIPTQLYLDSAYSNSSSEVLGNDWEEHYLDQDVSIKDNRIWQKYRLIDKKKAIEIGPGKGELFRELEKNQWTVFAIEKGAWLQSANVFTAPSELPRDFTCNIIIMQDVIEHLSSPLQSLQEYLPFLEEGGVLEITCPYGDSLDAKILGSAWEMIRPFGHLHFFSKKSIRVLANNADLAVENIFVFSRRSRAKSALRLILLPLLYLKTEICSVENMQNPYQFKNLKSIITLAFSSGDQLHVTLKKSNNSM
jgi:SAM-dependent methyltransferase